MGVDGCRDLSHLGVLGLGVGTSFWATQLRGIRLVWGTRLAVERVEVGSIFAFSWATTITMEVIAKHWTISIRQLPGVVG